MFILKHRKLTAVTKIFFTVKMMCNYNFIIALLKAESSEQQNKLPTYRYNIQLYFKSRCIKLTMLNLKTLKLYCSHNNILHSQNDVHLNFIIN